MGEIMTIGVVSDTHGVLPDKALGILRGEYAERSIAKSLSVGGASREGLTGKAADLIVHAGDIGELEPLSQDVIDKLEQIAPVHAVLGNRDVEGYMAGGTPVSEQLLTFDAAGALFAVAHKPEDLMAGVRGAGIDPIVRVHGHTHVARLERFGKGLILCPGSLRNPRGDNPRRSVALVHVMDGSGGVMAEIVNL